LHATHLSTLFLDGLTLVGEGMTREKQLLLLVLPLLLYQIELLF
jgi:hypothetical protein